LAKDYFNQAKDLWKQLVQEAPLVKEYKDNLDKVIRILAGL